MCGGHMGWQMPCSGCHPFFASTGEACSGQQIQCPVCSRFVVNTDEAWWGQQMGDIDKNMTRLECRIVCVLNVLCQHEKYVWAPGRLFILCGTLGLEQFVVMDIGMILLYQDSSGCR